MPLVSSLSGQLLRLRALPALCGAESRGFCPSHSLLRRLRAADIFLPATKICRAAGPDGRPWQPSSNPIGGWILSSKGLRRAATDSGGSANRQGRPPPDLAALRRNFRLGRTAACPWPHRAPPWANCQTPPCMCPAARPEMQTQRPSYSLPMRAAGQWRSAFVRCLWAFLSPDGRAYLGVSESMSDAAVSSCAQPVISPCGCWIFCPLPPRGRSELYKNMASCCKMPPPHGRSEHVCIVKAVIDPPAARHIRAKPLVRADETFPLTAISYDNRMFSDVFGPCFPRIAICQQERRFLLRDLASSPRAHSRAREAIGPDGASPRPQSVATTACSTILPAHTFRTQLFTNGGKSSVAHCFLSPRAWQALGLLYAMSSQSPSPPHAVGHGDRQFP